MHKLRTMVAIVSVFAGQKQPCVLVFLPQGAGSRIFCRCCLRAEG